MLAVTVPLVRNVDGERSEGQSSVSGGGVLTSGEWIVINLLVANNVLPSNEQWRRVALGGP